MIQCPWHGWEYDLETGQSYAKDSSIRPYRVEVEGGEAVADELEHGKAHAREPGGAGELARGLSGPKLEKGPFVAETFPVSVEDDYLVVSMPGRVRPPAATAGGGT
nr:hypothetical protein [Baekduia soli]